MQKHQLISRVFASKFCEFCLVFCDLCFGSVMMIVVVQMLTTCHPLTTGHQEIIHDNDELKL